MTTLENITKELETVKLKLKFADASTTVINAFNNKENFEFVAWYSERTIQLFRRDKIIYLGDFQFSKNDISNYVRDYNDIKADFSTEQQIETKKVLKAMKFVLANVETSFDLMQIAFSINKEINK